MVHKIKKNWILIMPDSELTKSIFIELLRSYHDGIGVTHGAQPQKDVAHHIAKDAYFMAMEYERTIQELNNV